MPPLPCVSTHPSSMYRLRCTVFDGLFDGLFDVLFDMPPLISSVTSKDAPCALSLPRGLALPDAPNSKAVPRFSTTRTPIYFACGNGVVRRVHRVAPASSGVTASPCTCFGARGPMCPLVTARGTGRSLVGQSALASAADQSRERPNLVWERDAGQGAAREPLDAPSDQMACARYGLVPRHRARADPFVLVVPVVAASARGVEEYSSWRTPSLSVFRRPPRSSGFA